MWKVMGRGYGALRGHSTQGQSPDTIGDYLDSQLCCLHDMQLCGGAKFIYCPSFQRAGLHPLSKYSFSFHLFSKLKICWVSAFIKDKQGNRYPALTKNKTMKRR